MLSAVRLSTCTLGGPSGVLLKHSVDPRGTLRVSSGGPPECGAPRALWGPDLAGPAPCPCAPASASHAALFLWHRFIKFSRIPLPPVLNVNSSPRVQPRESDYTIDFRCGHGLQGTSADRRVINARSNLESVFKTLIFYEKRL